MEVMESLGEVTTRSSSDCGYCGKPNHDESKCFIKERNKGIPRRKKGGCDNCGKMDHWKRDCPEKPIKDRFTDVKASHSTMGRDKRGAGGMPRQVGRGVHSGDIGSNTLRPSDCSRCKYATKLTACAGCQKTSNITHCLLHCTAFNALSVNDKVSVVKSSKACAICLHPSYTSKRYDYKDKEKMFVVWMVVSLTTIPVYMATETHM